MILGGSLIAAYVILNRHGGIQGIFPVGSSSLPPLPDNISDPSSDPFIQQMDDARILSAPPVPIVVPPTIVFQPQYITLAELRAAQYIYYFKIGHKPPRQRDADLDIIIEHIRLARQRRSRSSLHIDFDEGERELTYLIQINAPQSEIERKAKDVGRRFTHLEDVDPVVKTDIHIDINKGNRNNPPPRRQPPSNAPPPPRPTPRPTPDPQLPPPHIPRQRTPRPSPTPVGGGTGGGSPPPRPTPSPKPPKLVVPKPPKRVVKVAPTAGGGGSAGASGTGGAGGVVKSSGFSYDEDYSTDYDYF